MYSRKNFEPENIEEILQDERVLGFLKRRDEATKQRNNIGVTEAVGDSSRGRIESLHDIGMKQSPVESPSGSDEQLSGPNKKLSPTDSSLASEVVDQEVSVPGNGAHRRAGNAHAYNNTYMLTQFRQQQANEGSHAQA